MEASTSKERDGSQTPELELDLPADKPQELEQNGDPATAGMELATKRPANGDEIKQEIPAKRPRTAVQDAEGRSRQKRLFGVLTKTLSRFQEDTKKDSEASKRRQAVEERLAAKLRGENEALEAKSGKERVRRNLRFEIMKREDERSSLVAIYMSRRTSKSHLANFLCTKHDISDSSSTLGNLKSPCLPELPHALSPSNLSSSRPLYYLPYKLLPWQADKIDGQVEDMRLELDKEEASWTEQLGERDAELSEMKSSLDTLNAEAAAEGGGDMRRTRLRHEDEEMTLDTLPSRASLPPKDEREDSKDAMENGDSNDAYKEEDRDDANIAGVAEGEDVIEY